MSIPYRVGHGYDLHRIKAGGSLMMGGVHVADGISPVAHSDGDVALHSLVDALLGAMGWGDIGELFPNSDPKWKDAASWVFVKEVFGRVKSAGYCVLNCDITILAERPVLQRFKPRIRKNVADLLHVPLEQVNIKAGTNEGCDSIGKGKAIAAHAVVMLELDSA
jgi:2-C-methyl-D-erythritol 2,4-cyclodiphosphate synthase